MVPWRWLGVAAAANAFVVPAGPPRLTLRSPPAAAVADYSFMLPASTAVATCCQLCGIGGAGDAIMRRARNVLLSLLLGAGFLGIVGLALPSTLMSSCGL